MSAAPHVIVHRDAEVLAVAVAARLVGRIVEAQAARGRADVVLTGGSSGISVLRALADSPARDTVSWPQVHLWWGDERFLPSGHADRNETQARAVLLAQLPLEPEHVHPMPASNDHDITDVDVAAARYSDLLSADARAEGSARDDVPAFDVLLLGVGSDAHIASLFPELPALHERERTVVGVWGAPKPPPQRITLTLRAIAAAEEVWLIASGAGKADAVGLAFSGAGPLQAPAGSVSGRRATMWLLDRPAATQVPSSVIHTARPDAQR